MTRHKRRPLPDPQHEPVTSAQAAGLRYSTDLQPGIRRRQQAKTFGIKVLTDDASVTPKHFGVLHCWSFPRLGRTSGYALMPSVICKRPGATWGEEEAALIDFLQRRLPYVQEQMKIAA
jgi:hypothetical protein